MSDAPAYAATRIIAKFGGPLALSRLLCVHYGKPPPTTVQSWQNSGIPVKWQHEVLYVAKLAAIGLGPDDFFAMEMTDGERTRKAEEESPKHRDAATS